MPNLDATTEWATKIAALGAGDTTTLILADLKHAWSIAASPKDLTTVYRDMPMRHSVSPSYGSILFASAAAPVVPSLIATLKQGATAIASWWVNLIGSFATSEFELTASERNAVSDWTDLRVDLKASGRQSAVSWVEMETPSA